MTKSNGTGEQWAHMLTRAFTLLGASLWHGWYVSPTIRETLGLVLPRARFVEDTHGFVHCYRPAVDLEALNTAVQSVLTGREASSLMKRAERVDVAAVAQLDHPNSEFRVHDAIDQLTELAVLATIIPFKSGAAVVDQGIELDPAVDRGLRDLRARSTYPRFIEQVVTPLVARELNLESNHRSHAAFVTVRELRQGSVDARILEERFRRHEAGERFVLTVDGPTEELTFTSRTAGLIERYEPVVASEQLSGMSAYPGIARGRVRIVSGRTIEGVTFEKSLERRRRSGSGCDERNHQEARRTTEAACPVEARYATP